MTSYVDLTPGQKDKLLKAYKNVLPQRFVWQTNSLKGHMIKFSLPKGK